MMKRRKVIVYLMSLLLLLSLFVPQQSAIAAESGIEMQFNNGNAGTNSNTICAKFKVVNKGGSSINLSELKLRYYYTKDADKAQSFYCDYSGMMSGGAHTNMTNKVTGSIVNMSKSVSTADTYIEVGFTSDAGSLAAGGTIEVQTRVSRSDWSNYDQSNDYSYKLAGSDVVWDQVAAFLNGTIVFGKSPSDEQQVMNPEISPKTATFNKSTPQNISIALTPNGNTFKGISGLTRNTHYTVSGNTVTLLSSYLSTLSLGSKNLTFDFGVANNPILSLTIKENPVGDNLDVTLATVTGNKGDTVTVPVTFANVANVGNIITCNFYLSYDPSFLEAISVTAGDIVTNPSINFASKINESSSTISFLFLDDTIGEGLITEDGVFANIEFKILGNAGQTANVKFTEEGAFGDSDMERISNLKFTDGGVVISSTSTENPTISPNNSTFDKYTPGNIRITLTPNGNSFVGITNLKKGTDYTVSGNTVTILGSYLSSLSLGSATLTFDFGAAKNPQLALTIKDSTPSGDGLGVTLATVTGNKGDTVTVPVTFANVAKAGNIITCNFYLSYNPSLLEAISVTAGDIVTNPSINFASKINESSSIISFLFLDDTVGDGLITEDGVFANIEFKILGNAGQTANVKFTEEGAFGDSDMERISNLKFTDGGVVISSTSTENPTISPNNSTFDKYTPGDIRITLTPNGNSFVGITDLKKGTDYTVSGNTVTILESYLSSLSLGSATLTFDFDAANNPQLALTIKDSAPSGDGLGLGVATVNGNENGTVTVPVTMTNASKVGNIGAYGFAVTYDSTLLKPISITDGDLLANKGLAKTIAIDGGIGMFSRRSKAVAPEYVRSIYLSFNSFESQEIKEDGVLVYIEFKILGKAGDIAAVSIDRNGVFENSERNIITDVSYTDGLVVITGDEQLDPSITPITASFDKYSPSDITVAMTPNENTFNGIIGLEEGRDYSVSSNTVKIFSNYLSSLELGSKSLTFDFGVTANPSIVIRIEDTTPVETDFNVKIGKVSGNTGDTVNLPVTLGNISKVGSVITCNFYMSYDSSLLEAVSVTAGDIIINAPINFDSRINNGTISILFLDNTIGDELITEDGEMLTITFKILGTESEETFIVFQEDGAFGDGNMERIDDMKKIDGSITIN